MPDLEASAETSTSSGCCSASPSAGIVNQKEARKIHTIRHCNNNQSVLNAKDVSFPDRVFLREVVRVNPEFDQNIPEIDSHTNRCQFRNPIKSF
jgi:hypothetical protein